MEKKSGGDASGMIKNTEDNKKLAAEKEIEVREALRELNSKLETIGNLVHDTVPVSKDEVRVGTFHPRLECMFICLIN